MKRILFPVFSLLLMLMLVACEGENLPPQLTIYFYNSVEANEILAVTGENSEFSMIESERDGWYEFTFSVDSLENPGFVVHFKYGTFETSNYTVGDSSLVYFTVLGNYASFEAAEAALIAHGQTRIDFLNSHGWDQVYAYVFYGEPEQRPLGDWPGTAAILDMEDLGSGWYYITVPLNANEEPFTIIFSNGTGGAGLQTEDNLITSKFATYVTLNINDSPYTNKSDAENGISVPVDPVIENPTTVYFYNSDDWANVFAYAFSHEPFKEYLGAWSGTAATVVSGKTGWYQIEVPFEQGSGPFDILFNNGLSGSDERKTADTTITDNLVYVSMAGRYASFEAAEASVETTPIENGTTVYFYNSASWSTVYAYAWHGNPEQRPLGNWPGTQAVPVEGKDDWYQIEVPFEAGSGAFQIIFNNNSGNQTGDMVIEDDLLYVSFEGVYASFAAAEASLEPPVVDNSTTVYFYNSDLWETVYAYAWHGDPEQRPLGSWPGTQASPVEGKANWYEIEVPFEAGNGSFEIIFNNNDVSQTGNIVIEDDSVYVSLVGAFASFEAAEASMEPPVIDNATTVYFFNSNAWEQVYAYVWHGDPEQRPLGNWPGTQAAPVEDEENWYQIEVPFEQGSGAFNVIFNNNSGNQTGNMLIEDDLVYVSLAGVFTSAEDAEAALELPDEPTTIYFYNSDEWSAVYAYAFYGNPGQTPLGNWPGTEALPIEGQTNWFQITVPVDVDQTPFSYIFNNGLENPDLRQTPDLELFTRTFVYITVNGNAYESFEDAEEAMLEPDPVETTLYFYDFFEWETLYAEISLMSNLAVIFHEASFTPVDGKPLWYQVTVALDLVADAIKFEISSANGSIIFSTLNNNEQVYFAHGPHKESSFEAIEAKFETHTTVYFYNTFEVQPFAYLTSSPNTLGGFPGVALNQVAGKWFSIKVPLTGIGSSFNIRFNDGDNGYSPITVNVTGNKYYLDGVLYETMEDAQATLPEPITTTLYFYNIHGWAEVYAHAWVVGVGELTSWPGMLATPVPEQDHWYVVVFEHDLSEHELSYLFSNGGSMKTPDRVIAEDYQEWNYIGYPFVDSNSFEGLEALIPELTRVYFYNNQGWAEVKTHIWYTDGYGLTEWPGASAIRESEESDWYYIDLYIELGFNIIFNNNNQGAQTDTITISDSTAVYIVYPNLKFNSKAEGVAHFEET